MSNEILKEDLANVVLDDELTAALASALGNIFDVLLKTWRCDPWVIIMAAQIAVGQVFIHWQEECADRYLTQKRGERWTNLRAGPKR